MNTPADIEFGPALPADFPAVIDLCRRVQEQYEAYWPLRWGLREGYMEWMKERLGDQQMFLHVARDPALAGTGDLFGGSAVAGPVVGMIHCSIEKEVPIYTYPTYALVRDIAVRPSHRRRGIAQRLLAHAAAWANGHGMNQLRLHVAEQNPPGRAAFAQAGFRETYQEMVLPL